MYERHFGITGPPFQLSPDPFFFFDSDQHHAALTAMRQAFSRELPFVVLTGEIGAGKTTILRAWLADAEAAGVTVAQLANTQLDAEELMHSVATAFGAAALKGSSAGPEASLRRFLRGLKGHAALLAIDEAQNLDRLALQSLVGLAEIAAQQNAELRICLAGQPELCARLADPTFPDLQSRVQQSCHIGPLEPAQTRQYIEHRLSKVGWAGVPSFDGAAFDEIHRFTGGVPRRINVLSNRLMLSQFLSCTERIDARAVIATAHALHAEIDEVVVVHEPRQTVLEPPHIAPIAHGALLLVATGRSDHIKAVPLLHALGGRRDLPPSVVVSVSDDSPWRLNRDLHAFVGLAQQPVTLVDAAQAMPGDVEARFERLVEQCRPGAVIVFDGDPISQCCATVARRQGVPLVHVGADAQGAEEFTDPLSARAAIGQLADLRFDCQCPEQAEGFTGASRSISVGNLLIDAVCLAQQQMAAQSRRRGEQRRSPRERMDDRRGYGVVALKQLHADARSPCRQEIVPMLRDVSRDLPLVWPMRRATMLAMHGSGLARTLAGDRIACIEELGHASFVRLLRDTTCVLTDCLDVLEEAAVLRVPCLSLGARHAGHVDAGGWLPGIEVGSSVTRATRAVWEVVFNGGDYVAPPALWDGHAATRIAAHLAQWLAESRERAGALVFDAIQPPPG